jgi:hypothetical protein
MRLDAWLRQERPLAERLRLVEHLAQALNAEHDRGEVLASVCPERIEVGGDLRVDLAAARRGEPEPGYAAPERLEGAPPSTAGDVYAVGAVAWEVLVGRPCGELPAPLAEVAPELPSELANAVMGCLERSPQWRPKDLTYLAQLTAAQQKALRGDRAERRVPTPRSAAAARGPARAPARRASRSHLTLVLAGLLLVAAAAASLWILGREEAPSAARAPAPRARPTAPAASASPTAAPAAAAPLPSPSAPAATPTAEPQPALPAAAAPAPLPAAVPTPEPTPLPAAPEPTLATAPVTRPAADPALAAVSVPTAPAVAPPPTTFSPAPREPVVLSALSPVTVRRPGKVLLDLRGSGFHADLRARVVALRAAPRGLVVARQKWVSPGLITVLLELEDAATPGEYAIALEDVSGARSKPLSFTVTK